MVRRVALAMAFLVSCALPAAAQINPFPNTAKSFAEADRQRMYGSMTTVLDAQRVGETATWTSEDGTFGGVSELREVYTRDGMRCGRLRHRFEDRVHDDVTQPDVTTYDIRACEVQGEGWKFAF